MTPLDSLLIAAIAVFILMLIYFFKYIVKFTIKVSTTGLLIIIIVFFLLAIFNLSYSLHRDGTVDLKRSYILEFFNSEPMRKVGSLFEEYVIKEFKQFKRVAVDYINKTITD